MDESDLITAEKRLSVTKDNLLITASYSMSLNEKRLLLMAIAKINPQSQIWKQAKVDQSITASEWADTWGGSKNAAYSEIKQAAAKLFDRSLMLWGDNINAKIIRWISGQEYSESNGYVTITFSGVILKYLSGMTDQFTRYYLDSISALSSHNSIRFYELARQFSSTGWRVVSLDDLRKSLEVENKYLDFKDLKRRVIEPSINEISKKTDLDVEWETVKTGRKITAIKLKITKRPQIKLL